MSTNSRGKLFDEYIPDVKNSDYEFNRFDKASLKNGVSVLKLLVTTDSYSGWQQAAYLFFNTITEIFLSNGHDVYCFICSPTWKKDNRITRHYGLGRELSQESEIDPAEFLFEKEITIDNEIIFYGVIKLVKENIIDIFRILSKSENGVLFSSRGPDDPNLNLLSQDLATLLSIKCKSSTFNLNIVEAINFILDKDMVAITPYAWEETGEYHLDIFKRTKIEKPD